MSNPYELLLRTNLPDVVVQLCLQVSSPRVTIFYSRTKPVNVSRAEESLSINIFSLLHHSEISQSSPVVGLLLTSLCFACTVCHQRVRLISDPLRLRSRRVSAEERELITKGMICSLFANGQESGHFVITPTHCMTNGPLGIYYPFTSFAKGSFSEFDEGGLASFFECNFKQNFLCKNQIHKPAQKICPK